MRRAAGNRAAPALAWRSSSISSSGIAARWKSESAPGRGTEVKCRPAARLNLGRCHQNCNAKRHRDATNSALERASASAWSRPLGEYWQMKKMLVALPLVALVAACGGNGLGRRRCGPDQDRRIVDGLSVHHRGRRRVPARQSGHQRDRRIDRHRRRHQAVLRRRRRPVPGHGQCVAADEGERICRLRQGRRQAGHRGADRHRRPDPHRGARIRPGAQPDGRPTSTRRWPPIRSARARTRPRPGRTSIRRFRRPRSASSARRRRRARATAWPT